MPHLNETIVYDAILNAEVRISHDHPDVVTAADLAAQAKVKMRGLSAQLQTVLGAMRHADDNAATEPGDDSYQHTY